VAEKGERILVVDDDRSIRRYLNAALSAQGYRVAEAANGPEALQKAAEQIPDLVILDLGLPGLEGAEVTRRLRQWASLPILILSVREQESEKIAALDAGADDYLTKPFGTGELLARIRVALRRAAQTGSEPAVQIDALYVDFSNRQVRLSGDEVALTPTEYDLLRVLARHAGKVLTHRQLLRQVWGPPYEGELHLLRVNISNLRQKIEPDPTRPHYVLTEPGIGYRLRGE
jgi:two-component system KDP operon response regulator KdpE